MPLNEHSELSPGVCEVSLIPMFGGAFHLRLCLYKGRGALSVAESTQCVVAWSQDCPCLGTGLPGVPARSSGLGCLTGQLPRPPDAFLEVGGLGTGKLEKKSCAQVPAPGTDTRWAPPYPGLEPCR